MNELRSKVREMNYDVMTLIDTVNLKKVLGGTENPIDPEEELGRTSQTAQTTTTVCQVRAVMGDLV